MTVTLLLLSPPLHPPLFVLVVDVSRVSFPNRGRQALEKRQNVDDDRIDMLESMLKDATESANEAEKKYEEVRLTGCMVGRFALHRRSITSAAITRQRVIVDAVA